MTEADVYAFDVEDVDGGVKFVAKRTNDNVPFMMALDLLERGDVSFMNVFLETLRQSVKYKAYFFETPPVTEMQVLKSS